MEDYLEQITEMANQDEVKEHCEDRIMQPLKVEKWMVKRVLYALEKMKG